MNTSLFSNMFKSLFGTQITPTAQQFVPITASDGTPAGISSMTNLMSVLGVNFTFGGARDLNEIVDGFSVFATNSIGNVSHTPADVCGIIIVFTFFGLGGLRGIQLLFDSSTDHAYKRGYSDSWGAWITIS